MVSYRKWRPKSYQRTCWTPCTRKSEAPDLRRQMRSTKRVATNLRVQIWHYHIRLVPGLILQVRAYASRVPSTTCTANIASKLRYDRGSIKAVRPSMKHFQSFPLWLGILSQVNAPPRIRQDDLGISLREIRVLAAIVASTVAALLAIEYFGRKPRKSK